METVVIGDGTFGILRRLRDGVSGFRLFFLRRLEGNHFKTRTKIGQHLHGTTSTHKYHSSPIMKRSAPCKIGMHRRITLSTHKCIDGSQPF
jgi:hypothetical protein